METLERMVLKHHKNINYTDKQWTYEASWHPIPPPPTDHRTVEYIINKIIIHTTKKIKKFAELQVSCRLGPIGLCILNITSTCITITVLVLEFRVRRFYD